MTVTVTVWYCRNCRMALRVEPKVFAPGCRCAVPLLPKTPTVVHLP